MCYQQILFLEALNISNSMCCSCGYDYNPRGIGMKRLEKFSTMNLILIHDCCNYTEHLIQHRLKNHDTIRSTHGLFTKKNITSAVKPQLQGVLQAKYILITKYILIARQARNHSKSSINKYWTYSTIFKFCPAIIVVPTFLL